MPPWSETTPGSSAYATCDRCPSVPAITPQQPSPLAEAKARFAASWDLATLQVAEIEQVALPSPPGFVVVPTEWSDPCDLRQVLRACPQGRDPTRTSQSDHAPSVSAGYYHRWHKLRVRGFQNPERSSLISKPHATWVALDGPGAVHTSSAARARRPSRAGPGCTALKESGRAGRCRRSTTSSACHVPGTPGRSGGLWPRNGGGRAGSWLSRNSPGDHRSCTAAALARCHRVRRTPRRHRWWGWLVGLRLCEYTGCGETCLSRPAVGTGSLEISRSARFLLRIQTDCGRPACARYSCRRIATEPSPTAAATVSHRNVGLRRRRTRRADWFRWATAGAVRRSHLDG